MHSIKLLKAQGSYSATKLGQKQGNCLCHQGLWVSDFLNLSEFPTYLPHVMTKHQKPSFGEAILNLNVKQFM